MEFCVVMDEPLHINHDITNIKLSKGCQIHKKYIMLNTICKNSKDRYNKTVVFRDVRVVYLIIKENE